MHPNDTPRTRIFWTSGKDKIEAMNRIGRDKPVTSNSHTAHEYAEPGDSLFCITIEEHPLSEDNVVSVYLDAINKEENRGGA